jgi:hypothetical protein
LLCSLGILIIIALVLWVQIYFMKIKMNMVFEEQAAELQLLKEQKLTKADSIDVLKNKKIITVAEKEKSFYDDVTKALKNNMHYEDIKRNVGNTDDADSLAYEFTKRYSQR